VTSSSCDGATYAHSYGSAMSQEDNIETSPLRQLRQVESTMKRISKGSTSNQRALPKTLYTKLGTRCVFQKLRIFILTMATWLLLPPRLQAGTRLIPRCSHSELNEHCRTADFPGIFTKPSRRYSLVHCHQLSLVCDRVTFA
jgi:hypothetical protein